MNYWIFMCLIFIGRGIISDQNDNVLVLVNGRVMNERTHYGAIPEKNFVILGDINYVDIIRGSGTALYGYGATPLVINIVTKSGRTYTGAAYTSKMGVVEDFQAGEYQFGHQFSPSSNLYIYAGLENYSGAEQCNSPLIFSNSFDTKFGKAVEAGKPVSYPINNDNAINRNQMPIKLFAQFEYADLTIWTRYSRSGQQVAWNLPITEYPSIPTIGEKDPTPSYTDLPQLSSGYQQMAVVTQYKQFLNHALSLDYELGYDTTDYERAIIDEDGFRQEAYGENKYNAKLIGHWNPNNAHAMALGTELIYEQFGLPSRALPDIKPTCAFFPNGMPTWTSNTWALFGEYQYIVSEWHTLFFDCRADKNSFLPWLLSPRFSWIISPPNANQTFSWILSRSARPKFAETIYYNYLNGITNTYDYLDSIEFRHDINPSKYGFYGGYDFFANWLHIDRDLIRETNRYTHSTITSFGSELEAGYKTSNIHLHFSHAFNKHMSCYDNSALDPKPINVYSCVENWPAQITKAYLEYKLTEALSCHSDLRLYHPQLNKFGLPVIDQHISTLFWNFGFSYAPNATTTFFVNGYNLMGLLNRDWNKHNYFNGYDAYRIHAPAIAVSVQYRW